MKTIELGAVVEKIQEFKYRRHNPDENCECYDCRMYNEILDWLFNIWKTPVKKDV